MVMNVIIEDAGSGEMDLDELQTWSDDYGLTMPVLSDPGGAFMWSHISTGSVGLPYVVLMDKGVVIDQTEYATIDDAVALGKGN